MDDLDREIEEAARAARERQWRGRIATIATIATFFLVGIVGTVAMILLFPEPDEGAFEARQREHKASREEPSAATIADEYSAYQQDRGRLRWKVVPVAVLAFASAYFVSKRLKPADQN
jgi:hypothetical protein